MKVLVAVLLLLAVGLPAEELARFTCERPRPWDAGVLHNVSLAARQVDGAVLKPGAEFSFNAAMLGSAGRWAQGTSFSGGREVRSSGGGICQVSSGLYNAAQLAGLEILERNAHSLFDPAEAYVPPGRDAMVTREGHSDFRFRNSTRSDLAVHALALGGRLTVVLLGHQRRRRRRWLETRVLGRQAAQRVERVDADFAPGQGRRVRKGFDGVTVETRLCACAPGSVTRCAQWSVDRYERVDELWRVGALAQAPARVLTQVPAP